MTDQSRLSATSTRTAGSLSEIDGMDLHGTVADGRTGQSACKNWLLLAFANRVASGIAKPYETAFMAALLAADIPSKPLSEEACDVANAIALLASIETMDSDGAAENARIALERSVEDGD